MITPVSWREYGVCFDATTEIQDMFFGDIEDVPSYKQYRHVQKMCYECPVQLECLLYALRTDTRLGVWGGLTESQRKRYARPVTRREGFLQETLIRVINECGARVGMKRSEPIEPFREPQYEAISFPDYMDDISD